VGTPCSRRGRVRNGCGVVGYPGNPFEEVSRALHRLWHQGHKMSQLRWRDHGRTVSYGASHHRVGTAGGSWTGRRGGAGDFAARSSPGRGSFRGRSSSNRFPWRWGIGIHFLSVRTGRRSRRSKPESRPAAVGFLSGFGLVEAHVTPGCVRRLRSAAPQMCDKNLTGPSTKILRRLTAGRGRIVGPLPGLARQ